MEQTLDKKIMFFGCPLDCDEKYDSIQDKLNTLWTAEQFDDPLDGVMDTLCSDLPDELWDNLGSLPIPSWLGPKPCLEDRSKINTENARK